MTPAPITAPPAASSNEDSVLQPAADAAPHTGTVQPVDPNTISQMPGLGRVGLAMVVVIAGILIMKSAAKRYVLGGGGKSNKAVRVLARSVLAPKQQVLLLQVGKRVIVVGDSGGRLSPLSEITEPDEVATLISQTQHDRAEPIKAGFGKLFGKATDSFKPDPEPDEGDIVERPRESSVAAVGGDELADLGHLLERVRSMQQQIR